MQTLGTKFAKGNRRGARSIAALTQAYTAVFTGNATEEDATLVLSDLANFSGFYRVNGHGVSGDDRAFTDGQRSVFGRVFRFLNMNDEERRELEKAARREALVDVEEGTF